MTERDPVGVTESSVSAGTVRAATRARADEAVIGLAADGTISSWSASARELTGYAASTVDGNPISTAFPSLCPPETEIGELLDRAETAGRAGFEGWCETQSGTTFWASAVITPVEGTDGFALGLRDETEQRQTGSERELLASVTERVAQADSYVEGIRTAIAEVCDHTEWAYGEAWAPSDAGNQLEYVTGHAADHVLGQFQSASESVVFSVGEGLPGRVYESGESEWIPDTSAEPRDVFHRTELAEEVGLRAALSVPITTDDGVVAVLTFFLRDHRDRDDSLASVVSAVAADLGGLVARKRTEEELERERALLGRIFTTSPVGLIVADTDGTIVRSNLQASEVLCEGEHPLVDRTLESVPGEFRHPDGTVVDPDELPVARALETGSTVEGTEFELADRLGGSG